MSTVVLANTISPVMVSTPSPRYGRMMAAVTPRKLWQACGGDAVVTLAPASWEFRAYVGATLGREPDAVDVVAPPAVSTGHAVDVLRASGRIDEVVARGTVAPFALDPQVASLASAYGLRVAPYRDQPPAEAVRAASLINTKAGFRAVAAELGLPLAPGGAAGDAAQLRRKLPAVAERHRRVIVKLDRGSNGYGNFVVDADQGPVSEQVERGLAEAAEQRSGYVYEAFLDFHSVPSIEMEVLDDSVRPLYTCDQRTVDRSFTGMVTPATTASSLLTRLTAHATQVGWWLHRHGYRGVFDLDTGLHDVDGKTAFVCSEVNGRRTGGTYLHELSRLLLDAGPYEEIAWRADSRRAPAGARFAQGVRALADAGLAPSATGGGVVLTADTLEIDGRWRYLVVGTSPAAVAEREAACLAVLGTA
ncbi:hypothetical protein Ga0074812_13068 [Parafrankia irregularis]|uniref:ATP-grasp domain-containing protein n=1 Tax=Parafrankia irregularis TaxID=795642 RepID=A0A0S4QY53_9ACTN|nr:MULTISPECIES: peptide ligase PGM1-related protein [Parafrankia]MBE3205814.1 hypothetical protein [Parafrankia sp. CH37]CUU59688.1 hypothetical protein Ga0074812_13068 [Parafrankia irregularis]